MAGEVLCAALLAGDGEGIRHVGWLIGQHPTWGQRGDWQYVWSDSPAATPLAVLAESAHRRHWVRNITKKRKRSGAGIRSKDFNPHSGLSPPVRQNRSTHGWSLL